jgi:hypothetical protein
MSLQWNKDINRKCKITTYNMFLKILLYGAKTWTCTERKESKVQATEIKFLTAKV